MAAAHSGKWRRVRCRAFTRATGTGRAGKGRGGIMSQANPDPMGGDHLSRRQFTRVIAGAAAGAFACAGDSARAEPEREAQHRDHRLSAAGAGRTSKTSRPRTSWPSATCTSRPSNGPPRRIPRPEDAAIFASSTITPGSSTRSSSAPPNILTPSRRLPALQLGKHVYCEKPLTHNVWEARIIREAAATAKVATQMGTQIHAGDNYRRVVELVQTGAIGTSTKPTSGSAGPGGGSRTRTPRRTETSSRFSERPSGSSPIPSGLDWDLWLGPAPARPFHEVYWSGSQMVPLVGFRQRNHERPGIALDRPAVLGAQAPVARDHRGVRAASPPRDRSGVDARGL